MFYHYEYLLHSLLVNYDEEVITTFKEVRNFQWLGFRVPYSVIILGEQVKEQYPFAIAMKEALRAYKSASSMVVRASFIAFYLH